MQSIVLESNVDIFLLLKEVKGSDWNLFLYSVFTSNV